MKNFIVGLTLCSLIAGNALASTSATTGLDLPTFNNCKELFKSQHTQSRKDIGGTAILVGWSLGFGVLMPIAGVVFVPFALKQEGAAIVRTVRNKHMVELIEQAESYVLNWRSGEIPGPRLLKLDAHFPNMSRLEVAQTVVDASNDMTLCQNRKMSQRKLRKAIESGEIVSVDLE